MSLKDYVDVAVGVFTVISLVVASSVALRGLNAWREQARAQSDRELARRVMKAIYRVRDEIVVFRRRSIYPDEAVRALAAVRPGDSKANAEIVKRSYADNFPDYAGEVGGAVYAVRWNHLVDADHELLPLLLEVEAVWGPLARHRCGRVVELSDRVGDATFRLVFWVDHGSKMDPLDEAVMLDKSRPGAPDSFSLELFEAVKDAESLLLERLKL